MMMKKQICKVLILLCILPTSTSAMLEGAKKKAESVGFNFETKKQARKKKLYTQIGASIFTAVATAGILTLCYFYKNRDKDKTKALKNRLSRLQRIEIIENTQPQKTIIAPEHVQPYDGFTQISNNAYVQIPVAKEDIDDNKAPNTTLNISSLADPKSDWIEDHSTDEDESNASDSPNHPDKDPEGNKYMQEQFALLKNLQENTGNKNPTNSRNIPPKLRQSFTRLTQENIDSSNDNNLIIPNNAVRSPSLETTSLLRHQETVTSNNEDIDDKNPINNQEEDINDDKENNSAPNTFNNNPLLPTTTVLSGQKLFSGKYMALFEIMGKTIEVADYTTAKLKETN